jgi:hypothetical protein
MTTEEFIAWFDGFTRKMTGRPSAKDWAAIIERVAEIDGRSPLKAWFDGLRVKVKGTPTEADWRQIKSRIAAERDNASKTNRLRDPFSAFEKKSEPAKARESKVRYPGTSPFGKKK